jgi:hypothetical protein
MIIAFPRDRCRVSSGKIRGGACSIVILPVVRIERWPEPPEPAPRGSKSTSKSKLKPTSPKKRKTP